MRSAYLALIPFLVAAPAQAVETAGPPDSAAPVLLAQGGPTDKRREVEKKREEERREKAEKARKKREAERKRREAEQRRKAEAERRRKAEAERKKREAERRRRAKRAKTGGCHRGVPASLAYYQKCAPLGVPWRVSAAAVQRIVGAPSTPARSGNVIFLDYRKSPGGYPYFQFMIDTTGQFSRASGLVTGSVKGNGYPVTKSIRLGQRMQTIKRLIPGSRIRYIGGKPSGVTYCPGKLQFVFNCYSFWQYECRQVSISVHGNVTC